MPAPSPARLTPEDRARLSRQTLAILDRLRLGPALNTDLAKIALKYTGRISDARDAGYTITCTRLRGGLMRYELMDAPAPVTLQPGLFDRLTPTAAGALGDSDPDPRGPTVEKVQAAAAAHAADYRCETCGRAGPLVVLPVVPHVPGQYRALCRDGCLR